MKYILIILLSTLLISCGGEKNNSDLSINRKIDPLSKSAIAVPPNSVGGTGSIYQQIPAPLTYKQKIKKNPNLLSVEDIKNIKTIEDLSMVYLGIENAPQKDNPDFIKFQRDQLLLMKYINQLEDPTYQSLYRQFQDIQIGKDIWPLEIKLSEKSYQESLSQSGNIENGKQTPEEILLEKNLLLRSFTQSKEYQAYMQDSQEKIKALGLKMRKYWTPEMIELDKDIQKLNKELYESK